ncbi:glycoside hydrolase family 10 protein [Parabacteroides chinchillae]|uniref:Uncharacterized lipoprotein YddW, UPF0748 family n=1 Tax=Parabacteroides chinchillae TaxID=871327 RepID=A0A8G2BU17_9BACT|nr:family 10 glycosylhydrolase [Parabacteroides chinchillae]SEF47631.1 Uncharacterized lipoprotein YddW, UPF0748 family [Parabacteroides chinchillae]
MNRTLFTLVLIVNLLFSFSVQSKAAEEGIRGVWIPAPRFTSVLHTYQGVKDFVQSMDELNMNSVFLVSYAETKTVFKSKVLTNYSTYKTPEECYLLTDYIKDYQSPTNDPVRDLIDEAHKYNIKVFFWFEYGFMGEGRPIGKENPILAKNPHWLGINNLQEPANYNNHDYYFNAYNPAVQNFMIELIEEAITLYPDIDGVQGDDRLPAMPRNSGYDVYTVSLYQSQHNGTLPPTDYNNQEWVNWRLEILNTFARKLHAKVKNKNPDIMVSFAPNPYPWCEEKLMQDWPQWCKDGKCDLLAVQCYRYSADSYRLTLSEVLSYLDKNNPKQLFAPGIILMEGGNSNMTPELLETQLRINRELGVAGEIFFYNEGINIPSFKNVLKKAYSKKLSFPLK